MSVFKTRVFAPLRAHPWDRILWFACSALTPSIRERKKGTPKNFCDKEFADLAGEICLKTPVLVHRALELFRTFFSAIRAIFWLWGSFLALDFIQGVGL